MEKIALSTLFTQMITQTRTLKHLVVVLYFAFK